MQRYGKSFKLQIIYGIIVKNPVTSMVGEPAEPQVSSAGHFDKLSGRKKKLSGRKKKLSGRKKKAQ